MMRFLSFLSLVGAALFVVAGVSSPAIADSIETQSNPVSDGAITIEAGNADRGDWSLIPWYEADSEDVDLGVDPYRVQIAHDSMDVYVHIQLRQFDIGPDEGWRIQLWVDSDQDLETGYQPNWSIGADSLLEVDTIWDFVGLQPDEWAWNPRTSGLPRDQSDPLDVAVQIPRSSIGNPEAFDFFVMGQNFPDGNPEDALPDFADQADGDFFTYELTDAGPQLQAGDANQDLQFDQLDLVKVQIAAKYLTGRAATWGEGDWNAAPGGTVGNPPPGDQRFDQLDIIAALAPGHYLAGPYAAVAPNGRTGDGQTSLAYDATAGNLSVDAPAGIELTSINIDSDLIYIPEPSACVLLAVGLLMLVGGRTHCHLCGVR